MNKADAIRLLSGTAAAAARAIGISPAAVSLRPDVLPPRIADRMQAALWRQEQQAKAGAQSDRPDLQSPEPIAEALSEAFAEARE